MSARRTTCIRPRRESGQILVLFALSIVVILAMAGVAIDAGRFLTQRRFLQNAADAGALAAANAVVQQPTATVASVELAARVNLAINLAGSAVGAPVIVVPTTPEFETGMPATGSNLVSGIALTDSSGTLLKVTDSADKISDIRVALRGPVDYTLGRVVGLGQSVISARAHVGFKGVLMPIAVRRYVNLSGPYLRGSCTEPPSGNTFVDLAATQETSCQGAAATNPLGYGGRTPASPSYPGPTTVLIGQGAQSSNDQAFRGFINLDIRNFEPVGDSSTAVHTTYNNVPVGANSNTLKNFEAGWIPSGYPGPDFPPVTTPPDPNDQVAIMDGTSAGSVVSNLDARFNVGDKILCALYDGTVMSIPDFSITGPNDITLLPNTPTLNAGTIAVTANKFFAGTVTVSTTNAPAWLTTSYTPSADFTPVRPNGTNVTLDATAGTATPQVDMLWMKGHSADPYLTDHYAPVAVVVGSVTKDLSVSISPDQAPLNDAGAVAWGNTVTFTATVTVGSTGDFPAGVTLSLEPSGSIDPDLVKPFPNIPDGSYWFGTNTTAKTATIAAWSKNGNSWAGSATFTINTYGLTQATYDFVLTASGTNASTQSIRRQASGHVLSQATSDDSNYVDITGFAVYQITNISSNSLTGQAISQVFASASDAGLRAALTPRLMPW